MHKATQNVEIQVQRA